MHPEMTTFEQARAFLEAQQITVEKSLEPKLWIVGGVQTLDKGGVIHEARAVAARQRERAAATRIAQRTCSDPAQTDLDAALFMRLAAAGWHWTHAKRAANGWHHLVSRGSDQRLLRTPRLRELVAEDTAPPTPLPPGPLWLFISQIRRDGGTQARATLDDATVDEYAEALRNGAIFPAVLAFFDGTDYWLADGFHRIEAARRVGQRTIAVEVRQGTRRDAVLDACGANANHGLRRSTEDKARRVDAAP